MTPLTPRRWPYGLLILSFLFLLALGWSVVELLVLQLHVSFAAEQTQIFEQMRQQALQSPNPTEILGCLDYTVSYYRSGTKQVTGSRLDEVVERHRAAVIREIIGHLRKTTGQDLGDDPQVWIDRREMPP